MPEILILSDAGVETALDQSRLREALEKAFLAITNRDVDVPERIAANTPKGLLIAMPGFVSEVGLATKLVSLFPGNDTIGVPTHQGMLAFFDSDTGTPLAVMGAERLTQARTATGSAIAAGHLARSDARVLTIIGAGAQAEAHLDALGPMRKWSEIRVWNRTQEKAQAIATKHGAKVFESATEAIIGADVVALCTHSEQPLFAAEAVEPGTHLSSVGIGRELPWDLVRDARVVVEWRSVVELAYPAGALDLDGVKPNEVTELGEVLAGAGGRDRSEEITIYKSVGHAAEDCAAARVVYDSAKELGLGQLVEI